MNSTKKKLLMEIYLLLLKNKIYFVVKYVSSDYLKQHTVSALKTEPVS